MSGNFFPEDATGFCLFMRSSRGPLRDRKRTRQISQFFQRSVKHPRRRHTTPFFPKKSFESVRESVSWGTRHRPREGQRADVKNPQKPRAFTLVFNGRDWTVGFRRELKWRSRRNGKTHQNEIQDSDEPWRRRIPWKNTDIFYITFCSYSNAFFLPPPASTISTRALFPSMISAGHPFARFAGSLAWREKATLHSRGTSKQNS